MGAYGSTEEAPLTTEASNGEAVTAAADQFASKRAVSQSQSGAGQEEVSGSASTNLFATLVNQLHITKADLMSPPPQEVLDAFVMDDNVPAAMRILQLSPTVREHRFHLVPGCMKEHQFWATLFHILRTRKENGLSYAYSDKFHVLDRRPSSSSSATSGRRKRSLVLNDLVESDDFERQESKAHDVTRSIAKRHSGGGNPQEVLNLRKQLLNQKQQIGKLQESLRVSETRVKVLEEQSAECSLCSKKGAANPHRGEWVMDKDSADFLALEPELKENLRREKAKRLAEVQSQMKFILETDTIESSTGKWSCCKGETYHAKGCI